jgi:tetratricopeptide (TPR) repeat protein
MRLHLVIHASAGAKAAAILLRHPRFTQPTSEADRQACQVCQQQVWTQAELAQFRIAQGNALALGGDLEAAIDQFQQAKALDQTLTLAPQTEAQRLAALGLLNQAHPLAKGGQLEAALEKFEAAQALDPALDFDAQTRVNQLRAIGLLRAGESAASGDVLETIPISQKRLRTSKRLKLWIIVILLTPKNVLTD